jgi:uncharacterized coiled-coil DUF342 family protein
MNWIELLKTMTPAEMETQYTELCDLHGRHSKRINALRGELGNLKEEEQDVNVRIHQLREAYKAATGNTIKRGVDADVVHKAENAVKALIAVVCEPNNMPLDNPLVVQRLAELRDAVNARRAAKQAKEA